MKYQFSSSLPRRVPVRRSRRGEAVPRRPAVGRGAVRLRVRRRLPREPAPEPRHLPVPVQGEPSVVPASGEEVQLQHLQVGLFFISHLTSKDVLNWILHPVLVPLSLLPSTVELKLKNSHPDVKLRFCSAAFQQRCVKAQNPFVAHTKGFKSALSTSLAVER